MNKSEKKILNEALSMVMEAKSAIEALYDARDAYYDDRSDSWRDGEKGEEYLEETSAIEDLLMIVEEAEEKFGEFELD